MPQVLEYGARLCVDGKEIDEYAVEESGGNAVTCYVASNIDQIFEIKIQNASCGLVEFQLHLDGKEVVSQLLGAGGTKLIDGVPVTADLVRRFSFGAMRLTGAIARRDKRITTVLFDRLDRKDRPYARIKFIYRPYDVLQAQGIVPARSQSVSRKRKSDDPHQATPPPVASGSASSSSNIKVKREIAGDSLTDAERAAKEERRKRLREELERVEAELDEGFADQSNVKRETSPIRVPPLASGKRGVIDLTLD
ncbi:hypothetical protein EIP91_010975 [Steccherinum ochraceum]|uniref:Uncharacterized protein n=1 Tax=Steccherinum ochraceum TaxID=92696 RepID=A0A4V2MX13_9APHY|nr:hypothetical protein EIP91_010975 [Steccherinum ochraceum]